MTLSRPDLDLISRRTLGHYDVSQRMAEASLLPVVRAAGRDTLVVADGTSWRHQIADLTRTTGLREAVHAVRVLARALDETARS